MSDQQPPPIDDDCPDGISGGNTRRVLETQGTSMIHNVLEVPRSKTSMGPGMKRKEKKDKLKVADQDYIVTGSKVNS